MMYRFTSPWQLVMLVLSTICLSLFNLDADLGETNDLAASEPGKVAELHTMLKFWRTMLDADPMRPNPEFESESQ